MSSRPLVLRGRRTLMSAPRRGKGAVSAELVFTFLAGVQAERFPVQHVPDEVYCTLSTSAYSRVISIICFRRRGGRRWDCVNVPRSETSSKKRA